MPRVLYDFSINTKQSTSCQSTACKKLAETWSITKPLPGFPYLHLAHDESWHSSCIESNATNLHALTTNLCTEQSHEILKQKNSFLNMHPMLVLAPNPFTGQLAVFLVKCLVIQSFSNMMRIYSKLLWTCMSNQLSTHNSLTLFICKVMSNIMKAD